jgi:hypothetical protein
MARGSRTTKCSVPDSIEGAFCVWGALRLGRFAFEHFAFERFALGRFALGRFAITDSRPCVVWSAFLAAQLLSLARARESNQREHALGAAPSPLARVRYGRTGSSYRPSMACNSNRRDPSRRPRAVHAAGPSALRRGSEGTPESKSRALAVLALDCPHPSPLPQAGEGEGRARMLLLRSVFVFIAPSSSSLLRLRFLANAAPLLKMGPRRRRDGSDDDRSTRVTHHHRLDWIVVRSSCQRLRDARSFSRPTASRRCDPLRRHGQR